MIRINLLPYRAARTKENIRKQISIFILSFILLIVILVVVQGVLSARTSKLTNRLDGLKKEVAIYAEKAKEVEGFKKKLDLLDKQIKVVDQLKIKREEPPKLLANLTELIIAGRMQFTGLQDNAKSISINGIAMDNTTIAEFMTRLERSGLFSDVNLRSSKQMILYNIEMKQFSIGCIKKVEKTEGKTPTAKDEKSPKKR